MSVKQMGKVWDLAIDGDIKFTLLALADHARHDGTSVYPSVGLLAHMTGKTTRTIQRHLRALEAAGLIVCVHRGGRLWQLPDGRRGRSALYTLTLDEGDKLAPYGATPASPGGRHERHGEGDTGVTQSIINPSLNREPLLELSSEETELLPGWLQSKIANAKARTEGSPNAQAT